MDFSDVLKWLKDGGKATRDSWEPYGQYVTVTEIGICLVQRLPEGGKQVMSWQAPSDDLLAEDWLIATSDGVIGWPDGTVA